MKRATMALTALGLLAAVGSLALAGHAAATMSISSGDFGPEGPMPKSGYNARCGGQDVSPRLSWGGAPRGARSLVLTMIDQDVKPSKWSHWIIVDLPVSSGGLPQHMGAAHPPAAGVVSGMGKDIYQGPCPPHFTGLHHYVFTLWAMPQAHTAIAAKARADEVEAMLRKTALASASTTATATQDQ
ncbi:MAG TPA: YbhB/YbcL family Raf kinase inhibitor-like protein [Caulobacteraceae bacterium]|jgi:hypothetical protein|nr:YbhB/YbcL family Raf kinase inhibitor-like protein [Caulobacteraceae bacterium]